MNTENIYFAELNHPESVSECLRSDALECTFVYSGYANGQVSTNLTVLDNSYFLQEATETNNKG